MCLYRLQCSELHMITFILQAAMYRQMELTHIGGISMCGERIDLSEQK